jgi:CheY-like chemotaxis protein/HPt (histidine-containing phosphotransfer) domain-containing protein
MDEKTQARLFTAFSQADASITRRFGGTGLGLVISRNLVELMEGDFGVQSVPDHGSTFTIKLPLILPDKQSMAGDGDEIIGLPDITGLSCLLIASPDVLVDNIAAYLTCAGTRLERALDLADVSLRMRDRHPDRWIWIFVTSATPLPLSELRGLAQSFTQHDIHFVVVDRETCIEPQAKFADMTLVGGNILTRRYLHQAVSIAAGRIAPDSDCSTRSIAEAAFSAPSRDEAERNGHLILIAEDNETNQMVVIRQLALLGFAADVAESGSRALELWRSRHYALILSDLHMPDMDGYQLATTIRLEENGARHIPIIALSADALKGQDARCRAAGMDDYLSKPLRIAALEAALKKWLGENNATFTNTVLALDERSRRPAVPVVDLNVLKTYVGDDPTAIPEFLHVFRVNSVKLSGELKDACRQRRVVQAAKAAHTLKSSAHYIGALRFSELCAEMENAGNHDDTVKLDALLPEFEQEFGKVIEFLDALNLPKIDSGSAH